MTNCIGLWFALSFLLWTLSSTFVCALEFGLHICVCFGPCCSNIFLHICSSCLFQPKNRHENGAYVFFGHVQSCTHPHMYMYMYLQTLSQNYFAPQDLPTISKLRGINRSIFHRKSGQRIFRFWRVALGKVIGMKRSCYCMQYVDKVGGGGNGDDCRILQDGFRNIMELEDMLLYSLHMSSHTHIYNICMYIYIYLFKYIYILYTIHYMHVRCRDLRTMFMADLKLDLQALWLCKKES